MDVEKDAPQQADTWQTWLARVQRAAVRIDAQENMGSGGEDIVLMEGADDAMMAGVEEAFASYEVSLTPELRALYALTLGISDPCSYEPCLALPALSGRLWSVHHPSTENVEWLMEELHQWPMEAKAEGKEGVVPFLVLATSGWAFLVVGPNGRFTNTIYGEGDLGPEDDGVFDKGFDEAFARWAHGRLLEWAGLYAEEVLGGEEVDWSAYTSLPAVGDAPPLVQEAYTTLIAPMEEPLRFVALTMAPIVAKGTSAGARVDEDGRVWEPGANHQPGEGSVVGLPFADYERVASSITVGSLLRPHPVEDNPFDDQAVEAWWDGEGGPARVGFLARADARGMREALRATPGMVLRVSAVEDARLGVVPEEG